MRKSLLLSFMLFMTAFSFAQDPATFEDIQLGGNGIWQAPIGENEMPSGEMERQETNVFPYDSQALVPESCEYRKRAGLLARSSLRRLPDNEYQ